MNKELENKTELWKAMERTTDEQRIMAEKYYDDEMMPLIVEEFISNNKSKVSEKVKYMILTVGTSYEPLVMNISLFKPDKILFLCTERTEVKIDNIVSFCALSSSIYQKVVVDGLNSLDIYKRIKEAYIKWEMPEKTYIDITGGTKAMSGAASMVGAIISSELVYIGYKSYLSYFRKPEPGTETLYFIDNPYEVFGDFEIEKAMQLFGEYNYSGARNKLSELIEKIPNPEIRQQLEFSCLLATAYEQWSLYNFEAGYFSMDKLINGLRRDIKYNSKLLLMDCIDILNEQLEVLEKLKYAGLIVNDKNKSNFEVLLNIEYIMPLMFTMQTNALICEKQEKYDTATLLLYRLLEMIEQRRLSLYNIYVKEADFMNINYDYEKLPDMADLSKERQFEVYKDKIVNIKSKVYKKFDDDFMSEKISLLDGFIHLAVLKDEIIYNKNGHCINKLNWLRSKVELRNNSIFAHGFSSVSKDDYENFKKLVLDFFKKLCELEEVDYIKYCRKMQWINPSVTKNYVFGVKIEMDRNKMNL